MFQQLFNLLNDGQILTITLLRQADKLTVGVLPQAPNVQDSAKSQIIPLNLIGTPTELDEGFFGAICTPVQKASGILRNMELYEEKTEKAAGESKALKEKTEKINKSIKDAEALETTKPREALIAYKKILEQDKYNSKVISKIKALESKLSEGSLFGQEEVITIVPPVQEEIITPVKQEEINHTIENVPNTPLNQTTVVNINPQMQNSSIQTQAPVDMFAQVVAANQPIKEGTTKEIGNTTKTPIDPVKYEQFLQFMAMQEA